MRYIYLFTVAFLLFFGSAGFAFADTENSGSDPYYSSPTEKKKYRRKKRRVIRRIVGPVQFVPMSFSDQLGNVSSGNRQIDDMIVVHSVKQRFDPVLTYCMMAQESSFKYGARSHKGASGLMQLMPGTARMLGVTSIYDPSQNISAGVRYMKQMMQGSGNNVAWALAKYNAGPGGARYGIPQNGETPQYVRKITGCYAKNTVRRDEYVAKLQSVRPIDEALAINAVPTPSPVSITEAAQVAQPVEMEVSSKVLVNPDSPAIASTVGLQPTSVKTEQVVETVVSPAISSPEIPQTVNPNTQKTGIARTELRIKAKPVRFSQTIAQRDVRRTSAVKISIDQLARAKIVIVNLNQLVSCNLEIPRTRSPVGVELIDKDVGLKSFDDHEKIRRRRPWQKTTSDILGVNSYKSYYKSYSYFYEQGG